VSVFSFDTQGDGVLVKIDNSLPLSTAADQVWRVVGDFAGIAHWVPSLLSSTSIAAGPEGRERRKVLVRDPGVTLIEQEQERSGRTYSYTLVSHPFPVTDYEAELSVYEMALGPRGSILRWTASFRCATGAQDELAQFAQATIYQPGLSKLLEMFGPYRGEEAT
jgi:hypothetical protein